MKNFKRLAVLGIATAAFLGASMGIASPAHAASLLTGATIETPDQVHGSTAQHSSSLVSLGKLGRVELRKGNDTRQIAAGSQDTAGQATP